MSLKYNNKIHMSWGDIDYLIDILCEKIITDLPNIDSVFGITRGGLIPAVMISHKLDLPYSDVMLPNTLVVDDIADTGHTLNNIVGCYTATLHYKPHTSCFKPDIYAQTHNGNEFIYYPWETENSEPIADYLKTK
jgi:hypoxanthine phosphoribosyltransferase